MRQPEIIIALDLPRSSDIEAAIAPLPSQIRFFKIGLELFCAEGPAAIEPLKRRGARIFLDLKLHDIPRTVARAVRAAATHGVDLITVHAGGGRDMLRAAAEAARECGESRPRLLAITTLTSLDAQDLEDLGVRRSFTNQAIALTELALNAGIDGVVTSVHEAAALRDRFGPEPILVTPGIRMPSDKAGDQKRVATPAAAVANGADYLVIGRPILDAPDPAAAVAAILDDMKPGNHACPR